MKIKLKNRDECIRIYEDNKDKGYLNPLEIEDSVFSHEYYLSEIEYLSKEGIITRKGKKTIPFKYFDVLEVHLTGHNSSKKDISKKWALYRQLCSGNVPCVKVLDEKHADIEFPIIDDGGFDYEEFPEDKWMGKLCDTDGLEDYTWMSLSIPILEWLLSMCFKYGADPDVLLDFPDDVVGWFSYGPIPECMQKFALLYQTLLKSNKNEDQLQGEEISLGRREPSGTVVCFGGCSPSITVGHLSYTKILEGS